MRWISYLNQQWNVMAWNSMYNFECLDIFKAFNSEKKKLVSSWVSKLRKHWLTWKILTILGENLKFIMFKSIKISELNIVWMRTVRSWIFKNLIKKYFIVSTTAQIMKHKISSKFKKKCFGFKMFNMMIATS
jgi:hypothetical protein